MGLLPGKRRPRSSLRLERDSGTRTFGVLGEYRFLPFVCSGPLGNGTGQIRRPASDSESGGA